MLGVLSYCIADKPGSNGSFVITEVLNRMAVALLNRRMHEKS